MNTELQLEGRIIKLLSDKGFGFIQHKGTEYFFHKESFDGHWSDLVEDFKRVGYVNVIFTEVPSQKGPRAGEVKRTDYPNQAV